MMEILSDWFAPGPLFGWLCVMFMALLPLAWLKARLNKHRASLRFSGAAFVKPFIRTPMSRVRFILPMLRMLAMVALILAMARPQAGGDYRAYNEGIAIQMVLDISGSMAEEDFIVDNRRVRRIDAIKQVFEDFVLGRGTLAGREGDLIGMTTFAMYADTRCPLTLDQGNLRNLLRQTDIPGWVQGRQVRDHIEAHYTALGDAIAQAADDLRRAGEQAASGVPGAEAAKSRVMILLTDGQNNPAEQFAAESPDPIDAAKVAAKLGIKIYTIGAAGSAPARRGLFAMRSPQIDERTLRQIAEETGGKYFRATDTDSLVMIYKEIDQLERVRTGERIYRDDVAAAKIAMLAGLGLLMLEMLLSHTRFRKLP